jgi:GDP-L-fucose synthase
MGQLISVMIVGADGFIGSSATQKLSKQYHCIPIHKSNGIDFTNYNQVKQLLEATRPDVVLNCLAYSSKHCIDNPGEEVGKNLSMFYNFYANKHLYNQYINIGSGAEFDRSTDIDVALECDIFNVLPGDAYGFNKNLVARLIADAADKFITLRIFGCFGSTEWSSRLLKRFIQTPNFVLENDRYFDYVSIDDFLTVVKHVIDNRITALDCNVVYDEKLLLSEFLNRFCKIHEKYSKFVVSSNSDKNYTGSSAKLNSLCLRLSGLDVGLKNYL